MLDFSCKERYDLRDFIDLIAYLRSERGCPWDREQTHESIRRNVLEEAYEVCEAIDERDGDHLREELGDLLMQVIFHARMEEEKGGWNIDDVADEACKKLVHRHPHVFGDVSAEASERVLDNWDAIKRAEQQLLEMEERLGLARRFQDIQKALTLICDCALSIQDLNERNGRVPGIDENVSKILECAQDIAVEA